MARWVLYCPKCKSEFEHSQIADVAMARLVLAPKPQFQPNGNKCVCPNCGYSALYFGSDLFYRA